MPAPHPPEFRRRAVELARERAKPVGELAKDLRISESCLRNWMAQADVDQSGSATQLTSAEKKELAELRRDKRRLEFDPRVTRLTAHRRLDGQRKEHAALRAIETLVATGQQVTFADVQRAAGISSWFTYNNTTVRAAIEAARSDSGRTPRSRRTPATPAGLRADLAQARDEIRHLREERDRLRARLRRNLGAAIEQRDQQALVERIQDLERQRNTLTAELQPLASNIARPTTTSRSCAKNSTRPARQSDASCASPCGTRFRRLTPPGTSAHKPWRTPSGRG